MATFFATTYIPNEYSIKTFINYKGLIRSFEALGNQHETIARPYMFLDLLAKIMPELLYTEGTEVSIVNNSKWYEHSCLVVKQDGFGEKKYRLNQDVDTWWPLTIPPIHLRAMVEWWRLHREEFSISTHQWKIWVEK